MLCRKSYADFQAIVTTFCRHLPQPYLSRKLRNCGTESLIAWDRRVVWTESMTIAGTPSRRVRAASFFIFLVHSANNDSLRVADDTAGTCLGFLRAARSTQPRSLPKYRVSASEG